MKFDLVSDLHIDRWPSQTIDWAQQRRADLLVVAGDIADDPAASIAELKRMAAAYPKVLFIDGNHEHYAAMHDMQGNREKLRQGIASIPNAVYLHDENYIAGGVAFVGRNGWWDFRFGAPRSNPEICKANYLEKARETLKTPDPDKIVRQAKLDAKAIALRVQAMQNRDDITSIVCVTHTLPAENCISWGIYPKNDNYVGSYGSAAMAGAVDRDKKQKIKYWLFGHNHEPRNERIQHVTALSHPRGRPSDHFHMRDYKVKTLEIDGMPPAPPRPSQPDAQAPQPVFA